jgi:hypothetical protein
MVRRLAPLLLTLLALAGCGAGPGKEQEGGAELRVTRDFGQERLASARLDKVRDSDTVMRFLQSERDVETRYGGNFVQSIDGLEGEGPSGRRDWFYFVNGIEADVGAADYGLSPGDVVQWDHRNWRATMRVPAIVGAYPEPFVSGSRGKRFPVRVECEDAGGRACRDVKAHLADLGVAATGARLGAEAGEKLLRVVVATWPLARRISAARTLEQGPGESGVFARFTEDGGTLALLDEGGRVTRRVTRGAGLVAATAVSQQAILWLVTGTDDRGLAQAVRLLRKSELRDAFAVAATPDGPVKLPVGPATTKAGSG